LLDEVGDSALFSACRHDDLPASFPRSETGFDKTYKLQVQQKPYDTLDLVVEQESLVRISIHSTNPKNQVKAFLYEDSKAKEAIAWSSGGRTASSLIQSVKASRRAYRIKLEYESLDEDDACPLYTLRVILKPVRDVLNENLKCFGKPMPSASYSIKTDNFASSGEYAFGSDFIKSVTDHTKESIEYDIIIEWPNADPEAEYYLDVETRSDALAGRITFTLLYEDKGKSLRLLGRS